MNKESIFLDYKNSKVHLLRFGKGEDLLIGFTGYGHQAALFLPLEVALGTRFTLIVFDLPFHGQTEWQGSSYTKTDLQNLIQIILDREGKKEFGMLGYSYGGRIVQKMASVFVDQISCVFLMAPDGIFTRGMVNAHLVPRFVRELLQRSLREPEWLLSFVRLFHRLQLLSNYNHRFITYHIKDRDRRNRLFSTWVSMTDFVLRPRQTKALFRENKIPVDLYFGRRDEAIPLKSGEWMAEGVDHISLFILDEDHRLIGPALIQLLREQEAKKKADSK